ncbi:MAG: hypothetical protein A3G76_13205 [Acidobacteria bacterium RIFCSPLOWO2_12_FULL_65_11]|nr:MAG: hypothetical protein A3H95_10900 [Acidobacteria bacterium RIFCSPLOWO2_02_FULL_64_15]OFW31356.1 MAG: hypothetical protein A3G76_13205 [Acidobacteria bacterium RIFCSPLOWO2_12_FULL_65_11]
MDAPERYEQLIAFLGSQLPAPVEQEIDADGAMRFVGGEPPEVIVVLTQSSVVVSEFRGVWETPLKFTDRPRRIGLIKWRRLPETALWNALGALLKGAQQARLARFQVCQYCGQNTAPEWLHDDRVCQSCADRHSGAVH